MLPMALLFTTAAKAQLKVTDLRVEHMNNPTVVDETVPRFSWINEAMNEKERGKRQTAYQIGVATSEAKAKAGAFDMWDTDKQISSESVLIPYLGLPLKSGLCVWVFWGGPLLPFPVRLCPVGRYIPRGIRPNRHLSFPGYSVRPVRADSRAPVSWRRAVPPRCLLMLRLFHRPLPLPDNGLIRELHLQAN